MKKAIILTVSAIIAFYAGQASAGGTGCSSGRSADVAKTANTKQVKKPVQVRVASELKLQSTPKGVNAGKNTGKKS